MIQSSAWSSFFAEPYQPHSIPPNWGAHAVAGGPKFSLITT